MTNFQILNLLLAQVFAALSAHLVVFDELVLQLLFVQCTKARVVYAPTQVFPFPAAIILNYVFLELFRIKVLISQFSV